MDASQTVNANRQIAIIESIDYDEAPHSGFSCTYHAPQTKFEVFETAMAQGYSEQVKQTQALSMKNDESAN